MAKFSERRRYILRVIQPSTRSTLGEYDSRPPLARYVWCVTWYLRSSCCSETHYAHVKLPVFLPLSTLDVTHVRKCTRPSPLYRTASDENWAWTGNEARDLALIGRCLYSTSCRLCYFHSRPLIPLELHLQDHTGYSGSAPSWKQPSTNTSSLHSLVK